ncbi:MAG: hypothetical protein ACHQAW_07230 [Actinomycetota bacterium]|jgi:hypothetical protein
MDLTPHLEAIRGDLESSLGSDDALAAALERMARPLEASLHLRLLDVLGDAALELTEQLSDGHAEVRVSGKDASLIYVDAPDAPVAATSSDDDGTTARVTLRMPDALKATLEEAAETIGVSVNALLVQSAQSAVGKMTEERRRPGGNRISGYARS